MRRLDDRTADVSKWRETNDKLIRDQREFVGDAPMQWSGACGGLNVQRSTRWTLDVEEVYLRPIGCAAKPAGCDVSLTWPVFVVPRWKVSVAVRCSTLSGDSATIGIRHSPSGRRKW